ncbi:MAG: hypothetical protein M5T61_00965 [Acidimicrobiia bacterium]|nr:hypothetical protein [Acidimicrobiia bacterium]
MGIGETMFFGGFTILAMLSSVVGLGVLLLAVIILASGRGDPDPSGRRGHAVYIAAASFVALFALLFASFALVASLSGLIVDDDCSAFPIGESTTVFPGLEPGSSFEFDTMGFESEEMLCPSRGNAVARDSVRAGLVAALAAGVLGFHLRRRREMLDEPGFAGSAAWRVDRAYLQTVCFTTVLIFLFAGASAAYELFRVSAPGVTGEFLSRRAERQNGASGAIPLAYLTLATWWIFRRHWVQARPESAASETSETSEIADMPEAPPDR